MVGVTLYVIVSLVLVASCTLVIWCNRKREGKNRWRRMVWTAVVLAIPLSPYCLVEVQTRLIAPSMTVPVQCEATKIGINRIVMMKVVRIWPGWARVYIIGTGSIQSRCYSGELLDFTRSQQTWRFNGHWSTVWSDCGSADGNVFPPYAAEGDFP